MWIAIEGIDGAGKRTQATLLKERIERNGLTAVIVSFPRYGETVFARSIADYLNGGFGALHSVDPHLAALLYAGDRAESKAYLQSFSEACDVLILDRYTASNAAYQSARVPAAQRWQFIEWITDIEHGAYALPAANHTLLLDVPVKTASRLVSHKGVRDYTERKADIHEENLDYLAECRAVYHMLAEAQYRSRWSIISCAAPDGSMLDAACIHESIWIAVSGLMHGLRAATVHSG